MGLLTVLVDILNLFGSRKLFKELLAHACFGLAWFEHGVHLLMIGHSLGSLLDVQLRRVAAASHPGEVFSHVEDSHGLVGSSGNEGGVHERHHRLSLLDACRRLLHADHRIVVDDLHIVRLCFPVLDLAQVALQVRVIGILHAFLLLQELTGSVLLVLNEVVELVHALVIVQLVESLVID